MPAFSCVARKGEAVAGNAGARDVPAPGALGVSSLGVLSGSPGRLAPWGGGKWTPWASEAETRVPNDLAPEGERSALGFTAWKMG